MKDMHSLRTIADLKPGDHLCCIYETEAEHRALLTPFLRQGLEQHEKVSYIVDAHTAETVLGYLRDDGVDVDAFLHCGQLSMLTRHESYIQDGVFDPDRMLATLRAETARALDEDYAALRVTGEMTWALRGLPGSERLIEYETKLNQFFPDSQCLAICQYDRRRFTPEILLDVLRTHPFAVIGTEVYENFYYIPPDQLLGGELQAVELQHWMQTLVDHKQSEEALRENEERYRELANSIADVFFAMDENLRYTYWNKASESLTGIRTEDALGKPLYKLFPDTSQTRKAERVYLDVLRTRQPQTFVNEYQIEGKDFVFEISVYPSRDGISVFTKDITAHKQAEQERLAHLRFLETMDQVNRAIQGTKDLDQMLRDVLDIVLSTFESDRAFLGYPCDPQAPSWCIPMERTRPEYPGASATRSEIPMSEDDADLNRALLASNGPVKFGPGPGFDHLLPAELTEDFGIQSQIIIAIYPKVGKPWTFGTHQCSYLRIWTPEEEHLLQEIGRRLADSLSSLLAYRELCQSERLLADIAANYPHSYVSIIEHDFTIGFTSGQEFKKQHLDPKSVEGLSLEQVFGEQTPTIREHYLKAFQGEETSFELFMNNQYQQYNVVPLYDPNGHVTRILAVVENITERKQAEEQLKKSLREKEVLLQELYHRTKNNMNVIGAMLSMQAENLGDQRLTQILEEIKQRIISMAIVHEQLYESQDLSHVNLRAYTRQLVDSLLANYHIGPGNIALKVDVEPIVVLIETAIPYGLIVNELMTNALKYAFPDDRDGEIWIALRRLPGEKELELRFCDNGIGLPEDLDIRKTQSFGMKLITLLVDLQFKGTVDVQVNTGTEFRIRFQELNYKARV